MKVLQVLILMFALTGLVNAQKTVLTGTVYDDNGAVITKAVVKFRGADENEQSVRTNEDGVFEISLKSGNYALEIASPGFQTFRLEKYRIAPSYKGKLHLDIVLEVGPCDDCHKIEVDPVKRTKPN